MSALKWAAVPVLAGVLYGNVAIAAADEPAPPPTSAPAAAADPTPTPDPTATPTPEPTPMPSEPGTGSVVYLTTVTTTTTTVNAPIIVVAAPITTTLNTTSTGTNSTGGSKRERFVMDLTGCAGPRPGSPVPPPKRVRYAHVRLARDATLVVRVNRRQVATLRLPSTARHRTLRLRLAPNGMLSIHRPSGRVLAVQGCIPT
jgi:hypothetical protein